MAGKIPDWYYFYHYNPSVVGGGIFLALFLVLTLVHIYKLIRLRTYTFIPFAIGGICEIIGNATRIYVGHKHLINGQRALPLYIVQTTFLLTAVAFFAASIYMILVQLSRALNADPHLPLVSARWLTFLFVVADVVTINVQAVGGGLMAAVKFRAAGDRVTIAGVWCQMSFFLLFVVLFTVFWRRVASKEKKRLEGRPDCVRLMRATVAGIVLVAARSLFRAVEYSMGNGGYLMRREVWLYVFDLVLMVALMVLFAWVHPGEVRKRTKELRSMEEVEKIAEVRTNEGSG